MIDITKDAVQVLLDHPRGEGLIVSAYADTSVSDGFLSRWSNHLKQEVSAIEPRLASDPQAWARFERDLAVVRHALEDPSATRARGMAVFSAADRGLFRVFALASPVKDRLVLDEQPYLVPLLEAMHRQRRYLLVVTDSHHGRLYEAAWGHTNLLAELAEDVPRRQRSAGERWGKQQATIARHREDHLLHYRKALAAAIEQAWPTAPFRGLILLGDEETTSALGGELPVAIADQIVHVGPYNWATGQPDLDAEVRTVLDDILRAHDARLVEELERRLREHHLVAAGAQEVLNALRSGQVGYPGFIILEPDRGDTATRCTRCESVFTTMPETCPFCQGACEKVNVWQEILLFAARHNITAHTVDANGALTQHGGVAAVLSRAEPWEPAPAGPPEKAGVAHG